MFHSNYIYENDMENSMTKVLAKIGLIVNFCELTFGNLELQKFQNLLSVLTL